MSYLLNIRNAKDLIKSGQIHFDMSEFHQSAENRKDGICQSSACLAGTTVLANRNLSHEAIKAMDGGDAEAIEEGITGWHAEGRRMLGLSREAAMHIFFHPNIQTKEDGLEVLNQLEQLHLQQNETRLLSLHQAQQAVRRACRRAAKPREEETGER